VRGQRQAPATLYPPGKDLVSILQEVFWSPGTVWRGAENLTALGVDPRTFQPLASRYTDYAIQPAHTNLVAGILT